MAVEQLIDISPAHTAVTVDTSISDIAVLAHTLITDVDLNALVIVLGLNAMVLQHII